MELQPSAPRRPATKPLSWSLVLPRRPRPGGTLRPDAMNASELMFFFGAPLAHVIQYEEHLRESRREREFALARRTARFIDPAAIDEPPARARALELSNAPLG